MSEENRRVVGETPDVNVRDGSFSGHSTPAVNSPSIHIMSGYDRSDLGESSAPTSRIGTPASINYHGESESTEMLTESQNQVQNVQFGTDVVVSEVISCFKDFIYEYKPEGVQMDDDSLSIYMFKVNQIHEKGKTNLNIDCRDLRKYEGTKNMYYQLVRYPHTVIPLMDFVVNDVVKEMFADRMIASVPLHVRLYNLERKQPMRDLSTDNIDQLVCVEGMITRVGDLIPDMRVATFRCTVCKYEVQVKREGNRIKEPVRCEQCHTQNSFQIDHNGCAFADKQLVKMQEVPDQVPQGETPQSVTMYAYEELFDGVKPGDKVEVTAIYRAVPIRINRNKTTVRDVFRTYLDVIHYKKQMEGRYIAEGEESDESRRLEEEKRKEVELLVQMSKDPAIYEKLTASIAPSIWGMEDVKKGLLCMLFGGNHYDNTSKNHIRGDINILLCGDPGTSKSQLLSYVHQISPRGIYTSGKGSSAVGLTAYVTKDPETNDLILESGALVLSDKGICCIDEFDKMNDMTRSVLHEVMEQQTISVAKAGIICTLNARTSILAAANPVNSRYNTTISVMENIRLPPTLLSRFDLIYLILDKPTKDSDRELATHLVSLYSNNANTFVAKAPIEKKLLTAYISYARQNVHPLIGKEAATELEEQYVKMRSQGEKSANEKTITATPRQLESLIRLSESLAKMRFAKEVTIADVQEAARLIMVATQRAATDPRTGVINMASIYSEADEKETA